MLDNLSLYANQSWYVRLWRNRNVVRIPLDAVSWYWTEQTRRLRHENDWRLSWGQCWMVARGYFNARRQNVIPSDYNYSQHADD